MADPLLQRFAHLVQRSPESPLVTDGYRTMNRGEVAALGCRVADQLGQLPGTDSEAAGPENAVLRPEAHTLAALRAPNGAAFLAGWLALRHLGAAVLPLEGGGTARAQALGARGVLECEERWPRGPEDFRWRPLRRRGEAEARLPEAVEAVKLTSGSTGVARGVMVTSAALIADDQAGVESMGLVDEDRILTVVPMGHSYGLACVTVPALSRGCTLLLPPEDGGPLAAWAAAERLEASFLPTAPAYVRALVELADPPPLAPSLRLVITSGAPMDPVTARRFRQRYGRSVHVLYGASECGGVCFDRDGRGGEEGSVGGAMEGIAIALEPAPDGVGDLVAVSGPALALGYLEPAADGGAAPSGDRRLVPGRFRSSDLGRFQGCRLELLGRSDDLINIRGKKVYPREVESVLLRLEGVEEAVALGVERSGGGQLVRAVVACRPGTLRDEEVRRHCREHLAQHKVPRSLVLVERLPRTPRGKIDRAALRAPGLGSTGSPRMESPKAESPGLKSTTLGSAPLAAPRGVPGANES
ncbi:MAG: fatty acid--CoA ligase family protein [Acidobacteriota bacterium]